MEAPGRVSQCRFGVGKDVISAAFREVSVGTTQLRSQETWSCTYSQSGRLPGGRGRGQSLLRRHRAPSAPDPLPLRCQLALRCKGQRAMKGRQ